MRRIGSILLLFFVVLIGCKNTTGPLASKQRDQKPDPLFNSEQQSRFCRDSESQIFRTGNAPFNSEQQSRFYRDRLSMPEENPNIFGPSVR
jgi:hypothetical protein